MVTHVKEAKHNTDTKERITFRRLEVSFVGFNRDAVFPKKVFIPIIIIIIIVTVVVVHVYGK